MYLSFLEYIPILLLEMLETVGAKTKRVDFHPRSFMATILIDLLKRNSQ